MSTPKVKFSYERHNRKFNRGPKIKEYVSQIASRKTGPELKQQHQLRVANWKSDVDFRNRKKVLKDVITVKIFVVGSDYKIWFYVDRGTKPHPIPVRSAPFLVFQGNGTYKPKTKAVGKFGGPGIVVGGHIVKVKTVNHPGNEARLLSKAIADSYKSTLKEDMKHAMSLALR